MLLYLFKKCSRFPILIPGIFSLFLLGIFLLYEVNHQLKFESNTGQIYQHPISQDFSKQVRKISFKWKNSSISIEKINQQWSISTDNIFSNFKANAENIESFVSYFNNLQILNIIPVDSENINTYRLDQNPNTIVFELEANKYETIQIGLSSPLENSLYLRKKNQNTIFQVKSHEILDFNDPLTFIDQRIIPYSQNQVEKLKILLTSKTLKNNEKKEFTIFKNEQGKWQSSDVTSSNDPGIANNSSSQFVENLMLKLLSIKASTIIRDDESQEHARIIKEIISRPIMQLDLTVNSESLRYVIAQLNPNDLTSFRNNNREEILIKPLHLNYSFLISRAQMDQAGIQSF